ncbi:MAG: hypothetical protein K5660_05850 [Paludibacteraceae bacterium]|nr:hypothetical protein [Paludibacteraceae bacterium]
MNSKVKDLFLLVLLCLSLSVSAQAIPVPLTDTRLYDFIDELATDGIIEINEATRPYTRRQVADMLVKAQGHDQSLNYRQQQDLEFYLNEFSLERDTMPDKYVQWTDHSTFNLSLADPQFTYMTHNKIFKMQLRPILGMDIYGSKKGAIIKRWWGAELNMDIAHHVSIWGSLRDVSYNGQIGLSNKYFPTETDKRNGAQLTRPGFLNNMSGVQYKEADYGGDFSDSKGGLSIYDWWGSLSLSRENVRWGDAYHASNILSGRNPAVPQLNLQLTPVWWFQFDYFHAWLVSNVSNPNDYYVENVLQKNGTMLLDTAYRQRSKYMAANMLTFMPCKWVHFSLGNSIVYAENNPQAAYFIPIAFFKSLDHMMTKGTHTQNQNSQVFATVTVRPVEHLKLYTSLYADEVKWSRFKASNPANNPISYLVGFDWGGWPLKGLSLKGEFMRSYIACYTNSVDAIEYTSNSYLMGHYMGDNAQSTYIELSYRPIRGMWVALSFTDDIRFNQYRYLRKGIGTTIEQKPFDKKIFRNTEFAAKLAYEVHPNMYLRVELTYNNAKGYDNTDVYTIKGKTVTNEEIGEVLRTAQGNLNAFAPAYLQGKNFTAMAGFSFGF